MASKKKRRASSAIGWLIRLLLILILILLCLFGYRFCYMIFDTSAVSDESSAIEKTIRIDSTMSLSDVGSALENAGLIENGYVFVAQFKVFSDSDIVPGTYLLNSGMTPEEIIEVITTVEETEENDS